jgi:hypothetical protein
MLSGMFVTKCAACGKVMYAYAKNKMGELPKVYCPNRMCGNKAADEKRLKNESR